MNQILIEIITSPAEILKYLVQSKISGTMIGITSPDLGKDTCITAVRDIILTDEDDPIIIIKGYDRSGYFLERDTLPLKNITSVIPFTSLFENPFLQDVKKDLDSIKRDQGNIVEIDFIR